MRQLSMAWPQQPLEERWVTEYKPLDEAQDWNTRLQLTVKLLLLRVAERALKSTLYM
jgi:hypothetical protein